MAGQGLPIDLAERPASAALAGRLACPILACPIDGLPLALGERHGLACSAGHSFDRARGGYYNLLVVQHKASLDPGDSREMVAARRRFLDAGHFAPIADNASRFAMEFVRSRSAGASCLIVDAGCGEGTYLAAIAERLSAERLRVALAGIDISKWAIQAASKRTSSCFWAVGTNRHLPFAPGSVDLICSMFGFPVWDAFAGLQQAGGRVLLVDPGPDHLIELREIIYPSVLRSQPGSLAAAALAGYRLDWEERQQFQFQLDEPALIADLLSMTPHNHRAPLAGRQALAALNSLMVSADVVFRCLSRTDG